MGRKLATLVMATALTVGLAGPSYADHEYDYQGRDGNGGYSYDDRDGRECRGGGCDTRSRRCEGSRGDCRSSFSPGPFKDSPVTICFGIQPNTCNGNEDGAQQPAS